MLLVASSKRHENGTLSLNDHRPFRRIRRRRLTTSQPGETQEMLADLQFAMHTFAAHRSSAVQLTAHSNAFAERFVGSAKSECLARIVPLGEGHLRAAIRAFVQHYHEERPHQGLGNELIAPKPTSIGTGPVTCRARLGGVLKFYYRRAA